MLPFPFLRFYGIPLHFIGNTNYIFDYTTQFSFCKRKFGNFRKSAEMDKKRLSQKCVCIFSLILSHLCNSLLPSDILLFIPQFRHIRLNRSHMFQHTCLGILRPVIDNGFYQSSVLFIHLGCCFLFLHDVSANAADDVFRKL